MLTQVETINSDGTSTGLVQRLGTNQSIYFSDTSTNVTELIINIRDDIGGPGWVGGRVFGLELPEKLKAY